MRRIFVIVTGSLFTVAILFAVLALQTKNMAQFRIPTGTYQMSLDNMDGLPAGRDHNLVR